MSEPLKDIRSKVNVETWALLEAESRACDKDQSEVIREVLHAWAAEKWAVIRVAQNLARAAGQGGE